jgi:hypothetical protein
MQKLLFDDIVSLEKEFEPEDLVPVFTCTACGQQFRFDFNIFPSGTGGRFPLQTIKPNFAHSPAHAKLSPRNSERLRGHFIPLTRDNQRTSPHKGTGSLNSMWDIAL